MEIFEHEDIGKLIVRLMVSVLILFHGVGKLLSFSSTVSWLGSTLASHGLPEFIAYGVFIGEVIGPLMVLLGVFSRLGGVCIIANMLFAIGLMHMGQLFSLTDSGIWTMQAQMFFLFSGVTVLFLGSGRFALRPD